MQCCSPFFRPQPADPCAGVEAPLPSASDWFNNRDLAEIRLNRKKLADGDADGLPEGAVRLVQLALRYWGANRKKERSLLLPAFGPDGEYGSETEAAVAAFQSECNDDSGQPLVQDCVVGYKTLGALDRLLLADDPKSPSGKPKLIDVHLDFVLFPDGFGSDMIPRYLHKANGMYNKVGIAVRRGTTVIQHEAGPKACDIFEKNLRTSHKRDKKLGGWCRSEVLAKSINEGLTPEMDRLLRFRPGPKNRITVYHTAAFPTGALNPWAVTGIPKMGFFGFGIVMANWHTDDPAEIFWHELGHCLLNTGLGESVDGKVEDHDHDFMHRPVPRSRKISPAVGERMRDTALTVLGSPT